MIQGTLSVVFMGLLVVSGHGGESLGCNLRQESSRRMQVDELRWLTGAWVGHENGVITEEHWIEPRGGLMLAVNRTTGPTKTAFEFIRIQATRNSIDYVASPSGRSPTKFKMKVLEENLVVFENRKHDFPQKITYRREDQRLHVRIEGVSNGQIRKIEWTWQRKE